MKKKLLTILAGSMLVASVGLAAPLNDVEQNQTAIGYNHYNLDAAGLDIDNDSFYLEHGISDKFILGIERNTYSVPGDNVHMTDIYAQYKLDPNVRLIAGNRNYSGGSDKVFVGIGGKANLGPKVDGYASVTTSSIATEWQTGINYKLSSQTALQLGYKSYKEDHSERADGIGFGVNYTF